MKNNIINNYKLKEVLPFFRGHWRYYLASFPNRSSHWIPLLSGRRVADRPPDRRARDRGNWSYDGTGFTCKTFRVGDVPGLVPGVSVSSFGVLLAVTARWRGRSRYIRRDSTCFWRFVLRNVEHSFYVSSLGPSKNKN